MHDNNREDNPDGGWFNYGTESLFVINTRTLMIAFGDEMGFETIH
jgi:hypothetical protein